MNFQRKFVVVRILCLSFTIKIISLRRFLPLGAYQETSEKDHPRPQEKSLCLHLLNHGINIISLIISTIIQKIKSGIYTKLSKDSSKYIYY